MNKKWFFWLYDLKNIYFLYEVYFFFYYWGCILFNIKYIKLFIKSMFLMLLF